MRPAEPPQASAEPEPCEGDDSGPELLGDALERVQVEQALQVTQQLQEHRGGAEHQAAEERDRRASYCPLCDKQFTSPEQLREHVSGKWHKAREAAAQGGEWVAPSHSKRPSKRRSSDAKAKAKGKGKGDGAQNGAAQEAKPLFVRFGTETGGQIRVKGARKVLGGRMEKKRRKESNT